MDEYYADDPQVAWLRKEGETPATIGLHGGIQDTSELLATYPEGVRLDRLSAPPYFSEDTGSNGDPTRASAERGRALLGMKVDAAVSKIRAILTGS